TAEVISRVSARRVVAAAERARPASRTLTLARSEVAAGVRDLALVHSWRTNAGEGPVRFACPYKGLSPYEQVDAALFHGREDVIAALCARLVDTAFVAVVGPSGAGKSSLVRAGLLPALSDGVLPWLTDAPQWTISPGDALPATDGPTVIVVDQFEELFTRPLDDGVRDRYLD